MFGPISLTFWSRIPEFRMDPIKVDTVIRFISSQDKKLDKSHTYVNTHKRRLHKKLQNDPPVSIFHSIPWRTVKKMKQNLKKNTTIVFLRQTCLNLFAETVFWWNETCSFFTRFIWFHCQVFIVYSAKIFVFPKTVAVLTLKKTLLLNNVYSKLGPSKLATFKYL